MATHGTHVRLSEDGSIVIPAFIQKALGVGPGEEIILSQQDD